MADDPRNSMKIDIKSKHGFMKQDALIDIDESQNSMEHDTTSDREEEEAPRTLNYQLLLVMHADSEMRPCCPLLRVVSLPIPPNRISSERTSLEPSSNKGGIQMTTVCQLRNSMSKRTNYVATEVRRVLCIYAVSMTDTEAAVMIQKISQLNSMFSNNILSHTQRSNIAMVPVVFHCNIPIGIRCIDDVKNVSAITDVQLTIISMMEGIDKSRSLSVRIGRLHPYLATPENLYEAISVFMRRIEIDAYEHGFMKFCTHNITHNNQSKFKHPHSI